MLNGISPATLLDNVLVKTRVCKQQPPETPRGRQRVWKPAHQLVLGCVQILENTAFRKLATTRSAAISLVEHRRAHNICIELSGIRMPFDAIKVSGLAFKTECTVLGMLCLSMTAAGKHGPLNSVQCPASPNTFRHVCSRHTVCWQHACVILSFTLPSFLVLCSVLGMLTSNWRGCIQRAQAEYVLCLQPNIAYSVHDKQYTTTYDRVTLSINAALLFCCME